MSNINSSDPLQSSLLVSTHLEKKNSAASMICTHMKQIYKAGKTLQDVAQFTTKNGENLVCYGTTVVTGLQILLAASNPVTAMAGVGLTAIAAKKISDTFGQSADDITNLLQDAQAGLSMIETLEAANDQSFATVKQNLDTASQHVQNLNKEIEKIEHIADHGIEEVIAKKAEATKLYSEANELFMEAQKCFSASESKLKSADFIFKKTLAGFEELFSVANSEQGDPKEKLNQFVEIAKKMHRQCKAAKSTMGKSNDSLAEGQEIINRAIEKHKEAYGIATAAISISQMAMEKQKERCQYMRQYQQNLDSAVGQAQEEINHIEERRRDVKEITKDVLNDLEQAEERAKEKFGYTSLIMGVGLGGAIGLGTYGPVGGFVGGVAGVKAVHDLRNKHSMSVRRICDFMFGIKVEEKKAPLVKNNELIAFKFDSSSSGAWGRYIEKKQSWTVGDLRIKVGSEELSLAFNLNNKNRISKRDLIKLERRLSKEVQDGSLSAKACLDILAQLEAGTIVRPAGYKALKGFIPEDSKYFRELKRICNRQLSVAP